MLRLIALLSCSLLLLACAGNSQTDSASVAEATLPPTVAPTSTPEPTPEPSYQLVWQDEFEDDQLDESKWNRLVTGRPFNNEKQYYTDLPGNLFFEDGNLIIQANKPEERYLGREYTSAHINTNFKGTWQYGRFEMRAKLPEGQGLWPAFWLLPSQSRYGIWPSSGEIDIMEYLGHVPNVVHGTIHYANSSGHRFTGTDYRLPEGDFVNEFHIFAVEWEEEEIRWYVDDVLYQTQTRWSHPREPYPAPFNQEFYIILNVAVGGDWPGDPDETTVFPQQMIVDYVRVYQMEEQASSN